MANNSLNNAKTLKNDEFYTRLIDIQKELVHYSQYFENKIIYCNCDNPKFSNFYKFFYDNFETLGLKRLIATYKDERESSLKFEVYKINKCKKTTTTVLKQNGDFRSDEAINILKESDIVVTNPPFSLFREYIDTLIKYGNHFIVIGNANALTYKNCFDYIMQNKMWLGHNCVRWFNTPYNEITEAARSFWFSNLHTNKQNKTIKLIKKYSQKFYFNYDNYNAIEVAKTMDIPSDYDGVMGVPVTFLDKYNPKQFEIIGTDYQIKNGLLPNLIKSGWSGKIDRAYLNGKRLYSRIFIKHKRNHRAI